MVEEILNWNWNDQFAIFFLMYVLYYVSQINKRKLKGYCLIVNKYNAAIVSSIFLSDRKHRIKPKVVDFNIVHVLMDKIY